MARRKANPEAKPFDWLYFAGELRQVGVRLGQMSEGMFQEFLNRMEPAPRARTKRKYTRKATAKKMGRPRGRPPKVTKLERGVSRREDG